MPIVELDELPSDQDQMYKKMLWQMLGLCGNIDVRESVTHLGM
jgi:hypothetical protein